MIQALSAVTTVPLMTYTGSEAGTVTLTARYWFSTVKVTGTVAVVELSAKTFKARTATAARVNNVAANFFLFIDDPF